MSGGHFDYQEFTTYSTFSNEWEDHEIDALFDDLFGTDENCIGLVYILDYYLSGDTCEETYRKAVNKFKQKWFSRTTKERTEFYQGKLQEYCDTLKKELDINGAE